MAEKPNYYAIITANVRYDRRLKANEKLIYAEITALSNKNGYCTATNGYFSRIFEYSKTSVSKWVNHLKDLGYINVKLIKEGKEIKERRIYITSEPIEEKFDRGVEEKFDRTIEEKFKENTTSINNIKDFSYERFINWFNELSGKHFKNVESNRKLIRARLNEGYSKEDLAKVVKLKVHQWKDNPEMNRYLRLSTLLAPSHFDNYLQEAIDVPVDKKEEKLGSAPAAADNIHKTVDELEAEMNDQKSKDDSLIAFVEERPEAIEDNEVLRKEYEQAIERRNRA